MGPAIFNRKIRFALIRQYAAWRESVDACDIQQLHLSGQCRPHAIGHIGLAMSPLESTQLTVSTLLPAGH